MKVVMDITGVSFEQVGSTEAWIAFNVTDRLDNTITLQAWGISLVYSLFGENAVFKNHPVYGENRLKNVPGYSNTDDIYISGMANITITEVVGGEMSTALYKENEFEFLIGQDGDIVRLRKQWPIDTTEEYQTYVFNGVLDWPRGSCELQIASKGQVTIHFDTDDCILLEEYCKNPHRYSYRLEN